MVLIRGSRSSTTRTAEFRGPTLLLAHAIILLLLFAHPTICQAGKDDVTACDRIPVDDQTCLVDRSVIGHIKAIVHGTKNDPFWQQVHAGMKQTAEDMKINLELILYDDEDPTLDESTLAQAMVDDIQRYAGYADIGDGEGDVDRRRTADEEHDTSSEASLPPLPAAMIVSLPGDSKIEKVLQKLQGSNIPIFGINAIGNSDEQHSSSFLQGTVSMDETQAGIMAGNQIRDILIAQDKNTDGGSGITGIYINHRKDVYALEERFYALSDATKDVVESWEMVYLEKGTTEEEFTALFEGCKDTVIQLAGGSGTADAVLSALVANGCNIEDDHIVGTFDTSAPLIYDAMAEGTIKFAVSQQPYLQGSNAVLMAAMYATTGQKLTSASASASASAAVNPSTVQTGPILITSEDNNFPTVGQQVCEAEGFPVCASGTTSASGSRGRCLCTDRSEISISVLTHDESSDFMDTVFSGISQAATDFGVSILKNQFKRVTPPNKMRKQRGGLHDSRLKHTFDISEACQDKTTDGLIVSLPDSSMLDALLGCASRGIPYLAINAIAGFGDDELEAETDDKVLQYVGQKDYESGVEAGRRLMAAGVKQGWCLVHANFDTLHERCHGMEKAFGEAGSWYEFMGIIRVPSNDIPLYKKSVEEVIEKSVEECDWSGIGVLSTGREQIPALLSLAEDHPDMLAGTFDLDSTLYKADGSTLPDQIVFGIDQNAYMEGYLSVATMVWRISTSEVSTTTILETGPNFVVQSDLSSDEKHANPVVLQKKRRQAKCRDKNITFCGKNKGTAPFPPDGNQPYEPQPLKFTGQCSGGNCGVCEGDCDNDTDCGRGLVCFIRDSNTKGAAEEVPGCNTNPVDLTSKDFCVDARNYQCKDSEQFLVKAGQYDIPRNCAYVRDDIRRCKEYGRFCRETCGYCRKGADDQKDTVY